MTPSSGASMEAVDAIYVIPDLHGCLPQLRKALAAIPLDDPATMVVFLGDYLDRGPDSAGVAYAVKEVDARLGDRAVALLGNHEQWMIDWLDSDDDDPTWLTADIGLTTCRSFLDEETIRDALGQVSEINDRFRKEIRARHAELFHWLRQRPLYFETDHQIFVHAGIDEEAGRDWKFTTPDYLFCEKYPPSLGPFYKRIVAGHVGVSGLHRDSVHHPYVDDGHIYLDGSVEHTGRLNVLRYDVGTQTYSHFAVGG